MQSQFLVDGRISIAIRVGILLTATLLIYKQDFSIILGKALSFSAGNISNYVLIIPVLVAYIIYRKRNILWTTALHQNRERNSMRLDEVVGITLCLLAIVFYLYGSTQFYSLEYHVLSLPIFVAGATMLLFNIKTFRHVLIAIILLAYLQPPIGEVVGELAADLSWASAVMVQGMLSTFGMPVTLEASYGAPALVVETVTAGKVPFFVGEPSSGIYSTIGLSLFSLFFGYISRGPIWRRAIIFAVGFPIFFFLNMLRIATIMTLWFFFGEGIAESFHVVSGTIMVAIATVIILFFGEKILRLQIRTRRIHREECRACEKCRTMDESLCLYCGMVLKRIRKKVDMRTVGRMTLLVFIASLVMVNQITVNTVSAATGISELDIRSIEGPETTQYFLPEVDNWNLRFTYRDTRVEKVLNQDAALAYIYTKNATSDTNLEPTLFSGIQISTGVHTWESSLLTYPSRFGRPTATIIELKDINISDDDKGRLFIYQRYNSNVTEAVFYWFEKVPMRFGSDFQVRNVHLILWTYMDRLVNAGMIAAPDDVEGIEELFLSFARPISAHWNGISAQLKQETVIDAIVTGQAHFLIATILVPVSLLSAKRHINLENMRRVSRKAYDQMILSYEKMIIEAILESAHTKNSSGESIAKMYEKLAGKTIKESELVETLQLARKTGLIRDEISSQTDEPILVWKPNFDPKGNQSQLQ